MNSHTPTPWHRNIKPATKYPVIFAGRNTHIAAISVKSGLSDEEIEANLEFLIRAVNSHDALISALVSLREFACAALAGTIHDDAEGLQYFNDKALSALDAARSA